MVKFGRKFFFDKVYTKKNYTIPIIIGVVIIVVILTTFLVTRYFKDNNPKEKEKEKEIKIVLNKNVELEVYTELPSIKDYIKQLENIDYKDLELIYPEDLKTVEDISTCENPEETNECKKILATSLGEYKIIIKSEKIEEEKSITLNVIDTTKPILEVKEVTINEGDTYQITDFITNCNDNSKLECTYEYSNDLDEEGNVIDYNKYTTNGEYLIKIIAKDSSGNISDIKETKLIINKKKTEAKPNTNTETEKPKTCKYGDLSYSSSYVIATPINNKECAISVEEAEDLANTAGIIHNKKFVKEIQSAYLQNTIGRMSLGGEITYDITYGPVYNKSNKGVVGYYLLSEAKQTINGKTTIIARYFVDEDGNKVWKVNPLNLK